MHKALIFILLVAILLGCKEVLTEPDAELNGKWTDSNTIYTINNDLTYGIKYLRIGVIPNSVFNDSVYGSYVVDHKRKNITFNLEGYVRKDSTSVDTSLNSTTWHYSIEDDTLLNYESNTTLGSMIRIQ